MVATKEAGVGANLTLVTKKTRDQRVPNLRARKAGASEARAVALDPEKAAGVQRYTAIEARGVAMTGGGTITTQVTVQARALSAGALLVGAVRAGAGVPRAAGAGIPRATGARAAGARAAGAGILTAPIATEAREATHTLRLRKPSISWLALVQRDKCLMKTLVNVNKTLKGPLFNHHHVMLYIVIIK